jgi:hypothetical protein
MAPRNEVHSVLDWHDGPLRGVADHEGRPHYFFRCWDMETDEWTDVFGLVPVSEEELHMDRRAWAIWRAWVRACNDASRDAGPHPLLADAEFRCLSESFDASVKSRLASPVLVATADFDGDLRSCHAATVSWRPHEPAGSDPSAPDRGSRDEW